MALCCLGLRCTPQWYGKANSQTMDEVLGLAYRMEIYAGSNPTVVSKSFLLTNSVPEGLNDVSFFPLSLILIFNAHEGIHTVPGHGQLQLLVQCRQNGMLWRAQSWLPNIPLSFLFRWMTSPGMCLLSPW